MPAPKYDRPELRPDGFKGVSGDSIPHPVRPQPQPTGPFAPPGTTVGKGNNGK